MANQRGNVNEEKHVPFIVERENGYFVKIGKPADHPMTEEHYITEIALTVDGKVHKHVLKPGEKPEFMFVVGHGTDVSATETCNIHGIWENDLEA